jgi:hypothetical protein
LDAGIVALSNEILAMSKHIRGVIAARAASSKAQERALAIADLSEEYMPSSSALAAEALVVSHPRSGIGRRPGKRSRRPYPRSVWLLVGWLVVSMSMIAGAGGVVALYF